MSFDFHFFPFLNVASNLLLFDILLMQEGFAMVYEVVSPLFMKT